ncbi:hypothetical protein LTR37_006377 [Vermiconidia calcicola]|uniref:Uncharacterized protein n=1 Tax=Vermiconidia calcicola TaxID=1690605 RepID=A0ACC3NHH3_9PEZI|nr:hypothetical protein LTR37_006377 [Vermiconidia calcicola]
MRAWQYETIDNGIENSLKLSTSAPVPTPKPNQHLVRIIATALNPVDYKPAEVPLMRRVAIPNQATPGIDFVGRIAKPASGSPLKVDQLVCGMAGASALAGAALAEYDVADIKAVIAVPEGVDPVDAGSIGVTGLTAYQSIMPHIKSGSRLFLNGGSGGTGIWGIQIAKAAGCNVTVSCSTANVELCRSLGADQVLDYKKSPILEQLKQEKPFDHVVDNVGGDYDLYWRCHEYTTPSAKFIGIAASPNLSFFAFAAKVRLMPGFLGGGKRKYAGLFAEPKTDQLEWIAKLVAEKKARAIIDERFAFEKAPEAFRKLKTGRARGKILVDVSGELGNL